MSRIGKKPINVPSGVTAKMVDSVLVVNGPKGEIKLEIPQEVGVETKENEILITPARLTKKSSALWGLFRSLVANMVQGVTDGFEKKLEFEGIGYRANIEGETLIMQLGFSHPVRFLVPEGVKVSVEKNVITISGIKKDLVGETTARIRGLKPPEPYKGKGIRYRGEIIRRKAGKKTVAAS